MPKRKKYPKLPNGFGSIKYLGKGRRNPYAVHPPTKEFTQDGAPITPKALCYVDTWEKGFAVLTAYRTGSYYKGYESTLPDTREDGRSFSELSRAVLADFNRSKGIDKGKTFSEVYREYYDDKFNSAHSKSYSISSKNSVRAAFIKCEPLSSRIFKEIRHDELQRFIDGLNCGHSTQENIILLLKQMYSYAVAHDICDKKYSDNLKIAVEDNEEHGVPFSDEELAILWRNKDDPTVELLLIMCYSGYRIAAYKDISVDMGSLSFCGGVKTKSSKNRTVPIHSGIVDLVKTRMQRDGCMLPMTPNTFRGNMYKTLEQYGIQKHTPHDCRHTFSALCEKYGVRENDRKRMLGHIVGDITNDVYGHRTLEELREEIEKIKIPFCY